MSLQRVLSRISEDDSLRRLFLGNADEISLFAKFLVRKDAFQENDGLSQAFKLLGLEGDLDDVERWMTHQLWCAHRQCSENVSELRVEISEISLAHLRETENFPTILLSPMTVSQVDAEFAVRHIFGNRSYIFYGEGMQRDLRRRTAGGGFAAARVIRETLKHNGLFCTYADFAYSEHPTNLGNLLGRPRRFSSGFLSLAATTGACILPSVITVDKGLAKMQIHFHEPFRFQLPSDRMDANRRREQVLLIIESILESLVRVAGHQWLLLPTLTFETRQSAT